MYSIPSYFTLYLRIMLTDKIPVFWSLIFPLILAFVFGSRLDFTENSFLSFLALFWGYILLSIYVNGIGLQLARMREHGLMKTYIMISGSKIGCILALVLVQLVFAAVSLSVFTTILMLVFGFFSPLTLLLAYLVLLLSISLAFASIALTMLPAKISSMSTLINIVMYPLFLFANSQPDRWYSYLNPFYVMKTLGLAVSEHVTGASLLILTVVLVVYLLLGLFSVKRFNLMSLLTR
ncbi:hypothetical protein [Exiguobacterium sp. LL15]|uniref:hypothetical protein n=1 Tax=Exiguobacterium sp. LL15 TaxID=2950547 RepID=UPI0021089F2B|nr:hypothetical protein [Exiguobacterium sp. LL15]MCQ4090178.1 hypothetical protein [Exiguobacterium sp. LL15]